MYSKDCAVYFEIPSYIPTRVISKLVWVFFFQNGSKFLNWKIEEQEGQHSLQCFLPCFTIYPVFELRWA